jgi:hypothetical protein
MLLVIDGQSVLFTRPSHEGAKNATDLGYFHSFARWSTAPNRISARARCPNRKLALIVRLRDQELTSEDSFEIAEKAIRGARVGEISRRLNHT